MKLWIFNIDAATWKVLFSMFADNGFQEHYYDEEKNKQNVQTFSLTKTFMYLQLYFIQLQIRLSAFNILSQIPFKSWN